MARFITIETVVFEMPCDRYPTEIINLDYIVHIRPRANNRSEIELKNGKVLVAKKDVYWFRDKIAEVNND